MLVSDTSTTEKIRGWSADSGKFIYKDVYDFGVYWQYGYEVVSVSYYLGSRDAEEGSQMIYTVAVRRRSEKHIMYIDDKKQPLSKLIIVWQTKRR